MIIARTPLRLSFVGGGSDIPQFYRRFGGAALSMAINKYIYVVINEGYDEFITINYAVIERTCSVSEIRHAIIRTVLDMFHISKSFNVAIISDIHQKGSGLGSSSALTVGLLRALAEYRGKNVSKEDLARIACDIEINILGNPIGKQDQYASCYGGMNLLQFNVDESVRILPVLCDHIFVERLCENIILFYTGMHGASENVLKEYQQNINHIDKTKILMQMVDLAYRMKNDLDHERMDEFGTYLHENWLLKKQIAESISNPLIDAYYEIGIKNGALGGKLLGAGGRGYVMFYAPRDKHAGLISALRNLKHLHISLDQHGSRVYNLSA